VVVCRNDVSIFTMPYARQRDGRVGRKNVKHDTDRHQKQGDDEKAALALVAIIVSAGIGLIGLVAAAKRYVHHLTYGNAARTFLAALNLAEDLD